MIILKHQTCSHYKNRMINFLQMMIIKNLFLKIEDFLIKFRKCYKIMINTKKNKRANRMLLIVLELIMRRKYHLYTKYITFKRHNLPRNQLNKQELKITIKLRKKSSSLLDLEYQLE